MEEVFEKIIERLEKEVKLAYEDRRRYLNGNSIKFARAVGYGTALAVAIEIVNQVAKEYGKDTNVPSNADRIRAMSDEELAMIIMCPYDTAGDDEDIMPCMKIPFEDAPDSKTCMECTMAWLRRQSKE